MVCGTASGVGKSRIVTGICRALARRGASVAPFKALNMSLNSTVTPAGHEIARSQALQALAARTEPDILMGPLLLKPTSLSASQLVVMGRPAGEVSAGSPWDALGLLEGVVLPALSQLRASFDVVVLEGAGGAAEINLLERDIVNLPLARRAQVPAILVGDIERGGVFASLYGTAELLPTELREHLGGFVVNKLHGHKALLAPGTAELEERLSLPCLGVVPHLGAMPIDEEDSLALASAGPGALTAAPQAATLDVAVVRLPHISNFTDMAPLELEPSVAVRYVGHPCQLGDPDLVVLPGSKATVDDLAWLRAAGFDEALAGARRRDTSVLGICAGYQMLGTTIDDHVESGSGLVAGLGALAVTTRFHYQKTTRWRRGYSVAGHEASGYEIRHGQPASSCGKPWLLLDEPGARGASAARAEEEGVADTERGIWATSLHGLLEGDSLRRHFLAEVATRRGKSWQAGSSSFGAARESMVDSLADAMEEHLEMSKLIGLMASAPHPAKALSSNATPGTR